MTLTPSTPAVFVSLFFYDEMKNNPIFLSPGLALLFPWSLLIIVVATCLTITTVDKVQSTQQMSFFLTQVAVNKISCWQKYFMQTWHWYKSLFNFTLRRNPLQKKLSSPVGFFFCQNHYHYHHHMSWSPHLITLSLSWHVLPIVVPKYFSSLFKKLMRKNV